MFTTVARRIHRLAQFGAWMSLAMMLTSGAMLALVDSSWFLLWAARHTAGDLLLPNVVNELVPWLVMATGFVLIVSAKCGGFRREM